MHDNFLPLHSAPLDHLRYGFSSLETEKGIASHPVEILQVYILICVLKIEFSTNLFIGIFRIEKIANGM